MALDVVYVNSRNALFGLVVLAWIIKHWNE